MFRIFVRSCSQATKAEVKKSWHWENKQLYGQVVRQKKSKKTVPKCDPETNSSTETIKSSEMHWILGSSANRKGKLAETNDTPAKTVVHIQVPAKKKAFDDILRVPLILSQSTPNIQVPELEMYTEVPSVGKILQATMSDSARNALIRWKLSKIQELGEDGFQALQKENLGRGLRFHNLLQDYFTGAVDGSLITETDPNYLVWKSVQSILPQIEKKPLFVESRIVHPVLRYKGIVDCVSSIGNDVFAIEWKNSEKVKPTIAATFDAPLQLCAYLGALNANRECNVEIASGMVVVAYQNGRPADYYKLDEVLLRKYWLAWLLRVQEYWIRYRDGTLPDPIF